MQIYVQIDKLSDIQTTERQKVIQAGKQTDKHRNIQTEREVDRQTYRQMDIH